MGFSKPIFVNGGTPAINATNLNTLGDGIESAHKGTHIYAASATGTDAYAVTFATQYTAYNAGLMVNVKVDVANTGACTLNVDGLGAKSIKKISQVGKVDLEDNDLIANAIWSMIYDGTDFILLTPTANSSAYTQAWTAAGLYIVPKSGNYKVVCVGGGGGGGSGGSQTFASNHYAAAGGGGGSGYVTRKNVTLTRGDGILVTVGNGGSGGSAASIGGSGNDGGNGGGSSFGSHATANGGSGGKYGGGGINGYGGNGGAGCAGGGGGECASNSGNGGNGGTGSGGGGNGGAGTSNRTSNGGAGSVGTNTSATILDIKGTGSAGGGIVILYYVTDVGGTWT